ncbi:hypothetical protein C8R43DRAFT_1116549 [Mycena crocata]|nr:hypothetical protein C8R43DRAFT_1116549 [Mycena crocata]
MLELASSSVPVTRLDLEQQLGFGLATKIVCTRWLKAVEGGGPGYHDYDPDGLIQLLPEKATT